VIAVQPEPEGHSSSGDAARTLAELHGKQKTMPVSLRALAVTVVMGSVMLTGCASTPAPAYTGNPAEGRVVAQDFCSSCHAIGQLDASSDKMAPPFREILAHYPAEQLATDLRNARSISYLHMPRFFFDEQHPDDLVAYLKTLKATEAPRAGKAQTSN
jgi:mono/diheme cytochrome c family protein